MKTFPLIVKYIIVPCSSLVGIVYAFDMYIINRAKTVADPIRTEMRSVRDADMRHIDKRFDETQILIMTLKK